MTNERHDRARLAGAGIRAPLLGAALLLCAAAKGQEGPATRPAGSFLKLDEVVAIVNDRVITHRDVEEKLPKASPDLWKNPARLMEERQRILRQLATYLLLEQGIYSLPHEPDQIDQVVEEHVRKDMDRRMREAGSTQAFQEELRDRGRTFEEEKENLRSQIRWQIFMEERLYQRFSGRRGQLRIRPGRMLEIYGSQVFKERRTLPAHVFLEVYELGPEAGAEAARLRERLAGLGAEPDQEAPAQGTRRTRMVLIDCPEGSLGNAVFGLGLRELGADQLLVSRQGLADPTVGEEAFQEGPLPRVGTARPIPGGLRVVRVLSGAPARTLPFTDPRVQDELRRLALGLEQRAAEEELVRSLWESARIWPPELKRQGPLGYQR